MRTQFCVYQKGKHVKRGGFVLEHKRDCNLDVERSAVCALTMRLVIWFPIFPSFVSLPFGASTRECQRELRDLLTPAEFLGLSSWISKISREWRMWVELKMTEICMLDSCNAESCAKNLPAKRELNCVTHSAINSLKTNTKNTDEGCFIQTRQFFGRRRFMLPLDWLDWAKNAKFEVFLGKARFSWCKIFFSSFTSVLRFVLSAYQSVTYFVTWKI